MIFLTSLLFLSYICSYNTRQMVCPASSRQFIKSRKCQTCDLILYRLGEMFPETPYLKWNPAHPQQVILYLEIKMVTQKGRQIADIQWDPKAATRDLPCVYCGLKNHSRSYYVPRS